MGQLRHDRDEGIVVLTIDRPGRRNALDLATQRELKAAFEAFEADPLARVLVLTGTGTESFSAGADLVELASGVPADPEAFPVLGSNVEVTKPVIAAVNGAAYGAGFMLAQQCDLCVASRSALFAITEARWGRGAPYAATLPRLIPPRVAMELLLTAEPLTADRAHQIGLVNRVVAPEELLDCALQLARTIAANAPLSVRAGKALVRHAVESDRDELRAAADDLYRVVYESPDALEGPRAFREKRPPQWTGQPGR